MRTRGARRHDIGCRAPRLAAAIACCAALACGRAEYVCRDCNVVLISVDTLRADRVGVYGYGRPTTPNADRLGTRGVVFENAVSQSSWTRPAHMSMFTGLYPSEHGFVGLSDRKRLDPGVPTLARELGAHGYETVAFTGGVNVSRVFGFDEGFELFRSNGKLFRDNLEETRYWLDHRSGKKFFLFWHGYDVHTPYVNDPTDRRAIGIAERRPHIRMRRACKGHNRERVGDLIDEYDASVRRADRFVGKLLGELERRDLLDETVIIFTSDHGEEFLEHGACFHINTLYREVLHVPLIVAAPGLPQRRVAQLVPASVAIGPTILDLVGIEEHALPGPSLQGLLTGEQAELGPVVSETRRRLPRGKGEVRSVTTADRKLIHWITLERYELFDLRSDPAERSTQGGGSEVERLGALLAAWERAHPRRGTQTDHGTDGTAKSAESQELEEQLRALGYVE